MTDADAMYASAERDIALGNLLGAERKLRAAADVAPRAAQTIYLIGVCLFLQGRIDEARLVIDRAFGIKLWLREPGCDLGIEAALVRLDDECRDWEWGRYQRLVRQWTSIGFAFQPVVSACLVGADPTVVQVGANDGRSGDPLAPLLAVHDWRAVLAEPLPEPFAKLQELYGSRPRISLVNSAVTDYDGELELYVGHDDKTTLASALPDRNALRGQSDALQPRKVKCMTFEALFDAVEVDRVDLLQIDTEGMDAVILRTFDLERFAPSVVHLEFYCLPLSERIEVMERLAANGYAWRFLQRDLLAVRLDVVPADFCLARNGLLS